MSLLDVPVELSRPRPGASGTSTRMIAIGVPGVPNRDGGNLSTGDCIETGNPHTMGTGHEHPENRAPGMPAGEAVEG